MEPKTFRKITSRILRHSGFQVKMNKLTKEYEFYTLNNPEPILFCRPLIINEAEVIENYLCFRVEKDLDENSKKLYNRMINRFTRLAPSININFENESEPIFTDEQLEKLDELLAEHETKGDINEE